MSPLQKLCYADSVCGHRNADMVPLEIVQVCDMCGEYWGNLPGFAYCCRCNQRVFYLCVTAIYGNDPFDG